LAISETKTLRLDVELALNAPTAYLKADTLADEDDEANTDTLAVVFADTDTVEDAETNTDMLAVVFADTDTVEDAEIEKEAS